MDIKNNPSLQDLTNQAKTMQRTANTWPLLWLFGRRGREAARVLRQQMGPLTEQMQRLAEVPDKFNHHYLKRGWVASEAMHFEAMAEAVQLAEEGAPDRGEERLVEAHSGQFLRVMVKRVRHTATFSPRWNLIQSALRDHEEQRFHASVPVILAQIDGVVFDVTRGSFYSAKNARRLIATDSIAAHPSGLAELARVMGEVRKTTSTSVLDLPYRHGILHGRDLGYATIRTSTKAFCALLALREWVIRVEQGTVDDAPPLEWMDPDKASWDDLRRVWRDFVKELQRLPMS